MNNICSIVTIKTIFPSSYWVVPSFVDLSIINDDMIFFANKYYIHLKAHIRECIQGTIIPFLRYFAANVVYSLQGHYIMYQSTLNGYIYTYA